MINSEKAAIIDSLGSISYPQLWGMADQVALQLAQIEPGSRIGLLANRSREFVASLLGIWKAGCVCVPIADSHPVEEIKYSMETSGAILILCSAEFEDRVQQIGIGYKVMSSDAQATGEPRKFTDTQNALMLFTSGTTSRPKGVPITHGNLRAQIENLTQAWQWSNEDHILHVLPLHHTHGLVNKLLCAIVSHATVEILPSFEAEKVWEKLSGGVVTLFMAVPTVYTKLVAEWQAADEPTQQRWCAGAKKLRLMVSGSAALPMPVFEKWEEITSHRLLERYGMTEIGMALSNPYDQERRPGTVGQPLPSVEIKLVPEGEGEIWIKGPSVFSGYWERPEATAESFEDGWFKSGDIAKIEDGYFRILGRNSQDIIKSGGYKISALEIEEVMLRHEAIDAVAVVGLPDEEWGEQVAAAVVVNKEIAAEELRDWMKELLAPYKVPRLISFVSTLPRNAMGKVTKPDVKKMLREA